MRPGQLGPDGTLTFGAPFQLKGFIAGIYADAPARAKLLYFVASFTAVLACVWCRLTGVRKGSTTRYTAYAHEVRARQGPGLGRSYRMGDHDKGGLVRCGGDGLV